MTMLIPKQGHSPDVELQPTVTIMQQSFDSERISAALISNPTARCPRITRNSATAEDLGNDWRFFITYVGA
jgi:hypothetical protein